MSADKVEIIQKRLQKGKSLQEIAEGMGEEKMQLHIFMIV